jgi:FtsH-binding integral membrane protein
VDRGAKDGCLRPATLSRRSPPLRAYMQRVYSYMAGCLTLTGIVAYAAAASGF